MMGWNGFGWMGWTGWLWSVVMVLFWVGAIGAIAWLFGSLFNRASGREVMAETPLEILRRRYASGAITRDEYQKTREQL